MKSIINKIHLQFRCPVLQFDIESVDWDFNSKAGLWTIAHSKVKEIAFEYVNPSNGQGTIVHLLVTNVENDHLVNITLISDINGPQYSHSKFFCSLDSDCNVIKVAYEDCVSGEIKELVEKEEVDTVDEYVEALEDDDEEEIDIMEFSPVDQCTSDLDYDQFISLLFTLDGLLDIMHCGNVKIVTTDEEAEVGRLYIYPPTNDYTPSKIAASKRFSTDVGSFNLDALLTNELYI